MNQSSFAVLLLAVAVAGCSTDKKADAAQPVAVKNGSVPPRETVVTIPSGPYQQIQVTGGVRLTGTVDFDGVIPPDSIINPPPEMVGCANRITDNRVEHTGTRIGGAIVWITDIRSGKALPLARRFELANEDCLLSPRVQAVIAPATLNVVSADVALHRDRIINVGTGELEGIVPFNDNGEVVPLDKMLNGTEQLEITCDLHPWAKAHILAFDHPYFARTEKSGTFSIDDIPPGTYHVKAWHPMLGVAEQEINIEAGKPATASLRIGSTAAPAAAPRETAPGTAASKSLPQP